MAPRQPISVKSSTSIHSNHDNTNSPTISTLSQAELVFRTWHSLLSLYLLIVMRDYIVALFSILFLLTIVSATYVVCAPNTGIERDRPLIHATIAFSLDAIPCAVWGLLCTVAVSATLVECSDMGCMFAPVIGLVAALMWVLHILALKYTWPRLREARRAARTQRLSEEITALDEVEEGNFVDNVGEV